MLILFMLPDTMLWIISPMNYIGNQMAHNYRELGLRAVSVNASTCTPQGKIYAHTFASAYCSNKGHQVWPLPDSRLSPETYHDPNKLHPALLSKELAHRWHISILDEAHCIESWGETGFRQIFLRIGYLRGIAPN
jgi:superfamily II DNA helicase RecQ